MPDIVVIGEALVEIMRTGLDQPLDRPGEFAGPYPSGAPAIMAAAAARLGASVGFVGTLGDDPFGQCVRDRLARDGVDCACLRRTADRLTGIAFVAYRSDGTRSFVFHLAQSAAALVEPEQIPASYLKDTRYLHVMGSSLSFSEGMRQACYAAARRVHAQGGTVSLDPNLRAELMPVEQIRAVCEPILELAGIVMPSGSEATTLTGTATPEEAAAHLLDRGVELVALKQGERGSVLYRREGALDLPPFRVRKRTPPAPATPMAARCWVGLLEGMPLASAGLLANAVGALATTRLGPMEGQFSRAEVEAFMASQGRPLPK